MRFSGLVLMSAALFAGCGKEQAKPSSGSRATVGNRQTETTVISTSGSLPQTQRQVLDYTEKPILEDSELSTSSTVVLASKPASGENVRLFAFPRHLKVEASIAPLGFPPEDPTKTQAHVALRFFAKWSSQGLAELGALRDQTGGELFMGADMSLADMKAKATYPSEHVVGNAALEKATSGLDANIQRLVFSLNKAGVDALPLSGEGFFSVTLPSEVKVSLCFKIPGAIRRSDAEIAADPGPYVLVYKDSKRTACYGENGLEWKD